MQDKTINFPEHLDFRLTKWTRRHFRNIYISPQVLTILIFNSLNHLLCFCERVANFQTYRFIHVQHSPSSIKPVGAVLRFQQSSNRNRKKKEFIGYERASLSLAIPSARSTDGARRTTVGYRSNERAKGWSKLDANLMARAVSRARERLRTQGTVHTGSMRVA